MIKQLRCELTAKEISVKHAELTRVLDERDDATRVFGEAKADFKRADKRMEERIETLRRDLRSGTEERPVECDEVIDERRGTIETVRTDTQEVIDSRAMTVEERQTDMSFVDDTDEDDEEG